MKNPDHIGLTKEIERLKVENGSLKRQVNKLKKIKKWTCEAVKKGEFFFLPCLYTSRWTDTNNFDNFYIGFVWLKFSIGYKTSKNESVGD